MHNSSMQCKIMQTMRRLTPLLMPQIVGPMCRPHTTWWTGDVFWCSRAANSTREHGVFTAISCMVGSLTSLIHLLPLGIHTGLIKQVSSTRLLQHTLSLSCRKACPCIHQKSHYLKVLSLLRATLYRVHICVQTHSVFL